MNKPFLTIVTRACRRPTKLAKCIQSVKAQTCQDIEQIFLVDNVGTHNGNPILWANAQFERFANRVDGQYVYALDDDGMLGDIETVKEIQSSVNIAKQKYGHKPAVILVKTSALDLGGKPGIWPKNNLWSLNWENGERPDVWVGNGYCVAVRNDVWKKHIHNYKYAHGGDWMFITALCGDKSVDFVRLNVIAAVGQGRGAGVLFEKCGKGWFEKVAKKHGVVEVEPGDWRLRLWRS